MIISTFVICYLSFPRKRESTVRLADPPVIPAKAGIHRCLAESLA
ncbi:hypothetical protein QUF72_00585 [Desulfobacterales bacterium HSG2]|nr:hypothetical protein [Desulfobacterales bacterium HSG2]MDM8548532.1 hypothetical protein [Desulfobacterales bacterium HSG2]